MSSISLLMQPFALVLACSLFACHARESFTKQAQSNLPAESNERALARYLLTLIPAIAYNPAAPQVHAPENSRVSVATRPAALNAHSHPGHRIPLMNMPAEGTSLESVKRPKSVEPKASPSKAVHHITITGDGEDRYNPWPDFDGTPFVPVLKEAFQQMGFERPTLYQAQAMPVIMDGRDIISMAWTGTGKTVAYLAPVFQKLINTKGMKKELKNREEGKEMIRAIVQVPTKSIGRVVGKAGANIEAIRKATGCFIKIEGFDKTKPTCEVHVLGPAAYMEQAKQLLQDAVGEHKPKVLVLAPTDKLVKQISAQANEFTGVTEIWSLAIDGSMSRHLQLSEMRRTKPELIISTPGRCKDFIDTGGLDLSRVHFVVLDEADQMMKQNEGIIREILESTPPSRQTLMFSNTLPQELRQLAEAFVRNPIGVMSVAESSDESDETVSDKQVKQYVKMVRMENKPQELWKALVEIADGRTDLEQIPKTLIYVNDKAVVKEVAHFLHQYGYSVGSLIHDDQSDEWRYQVMADFKRGDVRVLVSTDLGTEGLDAKDVAAVINFDMPARVDTYSDRIEYAAHAASSYSFFAAEDEQSAPGLVGVLERAGQQVPSDLKKMSKVVERKKRRHRNQRNGDSDMLTSDERSERKNRAYRSESSDDILFEASDSSTRDRAVKRSQMKGQTTDYQEFVQRRSQRQAHPEMPWQGRKPTWIDRAPGFRKEQNNRVTSKFGGGFSVKPGGVRKDIFEGKKGTYRDSRSKVGFLDEFNPPKKKKGSQVSAFKDRLAQMRQKKGSKDAPREES